MDGDRRHCFVGIEAGKAEFFADEAAGQFFALNDLYLRRRGGRTERGGGQEQKDGEQELHLLRDHPHSTFSQESGYGAGAMLRIVTRLGCR